MLKRVFDVAVSILLLLLLSLFILIISLLVYFYDFGPVFYKGIRVGKNGKLFNMIKFRTMVLDAEKNGPSSTAVNDTRITKIGHFLRKYKIDEIPQLFNIVAGQMSFVGPRPQVEWAVQMYNEEEKTILRVRPGITDYASVKFYNEGELLEGAIDPDKYYLEQIHPEKMRLALEYVNKHNFWIDIKIIIKTLKTIIKK